MKARKVVRDEHGPRHLTPAGRSVFYDLFPKAEADELVMRSTLLRGLEHWLKESGLTQTQAAKAPGITQARVSDIKRGKIGQFSLDMLVRLASRAGLKPKLKLAAQDGGNRRVGRVRSSISCCGQRLGGRITESLSRTDLGE